MYLICEMGRTVHKVGVEKKVVANDSHMCSNEGSVS